MSSSNLPDTLLEVCAFCSYIDLPTLMTSIPFQDFDGMGCFIWLDHHVLRSLASLSSLDLIVYFLALPAQLYSPIYCFFYVIVSDVA